MHASTVQDFKPSCNLQLQQGHTQNGSMSLYQEARLFWEQAGNCIGWRPITTAHQPQPCCACYSSCMCDDTCLLQAEASGPPDVWTQLPAAVWGEAIRQKEYELQQRLREHAATVERAAVLQRLQAEAQAKAAALQEQTAADQAELAVLLQKQRQAEAAAALQDLLQEQQAELAAIIEAEADQAQTALLQGQVPELPATVAAVLERQG